METIFRKAQAEDVDEIFFIFKKAIASMNEKGIFQWDEIYPSLEDIKLDIDQQQMYILLLEKSIAAAVVLNEQQDKEYVDGNWTYDDGRIAVIHRLCVNPNFQGQGIGKQMLLFSEKVLQEQGYHGIRLDTFSQNPIALGLYQSLGYVDAGRIKLRMGIFHLFEKLI